MKNALPLERLHAFEQQLRQEHQLHLEQNRPLGEQDGRRNLPAVGDATLPPHEFQISTHYQGKVEEVGRLVRQLLHDIRDKQWHQAAAALLGWSEAGIDQQLVQARDTRDRKLQEAAENHFDQLKVLENRLSYSQAKSDIAAAEARLQAVAHQLGRYELHQRIPPVVAASLAVAIGLAEIPLNYQTFLVFRDTPVMTLAFACSLVLVLPPLSHLSGRFFRQGGERPAYYLIATGVFAAVMALSYFSAHLRTDYIAGAPWVSTPLFFTLNVLLFLAAATASYLAHDPSAALSDAHRALRFERRRHARILAKGEAEIKRETDRYQAQKEEIQRDYTREEAAILRSREAIVEAGHAATALYNQVLSWGQGIERELQTHSNNTILIRREANMNFRTNHAQPHSWKLPLPTLMLSLQQLPELSWQVP